MDLLPTVMYDDSEKGIWNKTVVLKAAFSIFAIFVYF